MYKIKTKHRMKATVTLQIEIEDKIELTPDNLVQYFNLYLDREEHYRPDSTNRILHALGPEEIITDITAVIHE